MIRILHLEDEPHDCEITREMLSNANLDCELRQMGTRREYLKALADGGFDLILADYKLPNFDGMAALVLAREHAPETPFILLAGNLGEEYAVEILKRGATDFVLKDRPLRLVSSIERAVREAAVARARRIAEDNAAEAGRRYRVLYDENPCIFFTLDRVGTILSVNRFGAQQLGYTREELIGRHFAELYCDADRGASEQYFAKALTLPEQVHRWELRKITKNGSPIWMRDAARLTRGEDGNHILLIVSEDTTETWELSEQLHYQTTHDEITGLLNRREFERRLRTTLDEARHDQAGHCLCYLDLDRFKVVNDDCGHFAGDDLLRRIAALLKDVFRRHDVLARVGSDEFAVLVKHCAWEEAEQAAKRLLGEIRGMRFVWDERRFPIGASIGTVALDHRSFNHQEAMAAADTACQLAREAGGNRIHIYNESDQSTRQHVGDLRWVPRINDAIASNLFFLEFQRIMPLRPELPVGEHFELLVRLGGRDGKIVMPGEFLPAAERYNVCGMIDQWVVHEALRWLSAPSTPLEHIELCSINLSARSLSDADFHERLHEVLSASSVPMHLLCFEVTETAAITNREQALKFVHAVKERGCKFALDDFGSGMASFAYLKHLPVDYVKIDGLFVRDILDDPFSLAMVSSICEVAHAGNMLTVAEFAAGPQIVDKLRAIGVDYAQGYGIARPAPLAELGRVATLG